MKSNTTRLFFVTLLLIVYCSGPLRAAGEPQLVPLETLRQEAQAATPDAVAFLSKAIQYQSVEDFGYQLKPQTEALLQYVFKTAKSMGFETRLAADGLVGVLEYGEGDETVGVLIHVDVVPATSHHDKHYVSLHPATEGEEANWTYPPFSGKVTDTHVWGRGAQDDKGALAAALWGAKLLIDNELPFKRRLRIILGTKEEKSFESLTRYFQQEQQPDFGLVPDGVYFIAGEKGIADLKIDFPGLNAKRQKRDTVVHWAGGSVINSVPDFSYMVFESRNTSAMKKALQQAVAQTTQELKAGRSDNFFGVDAPYEAHLSVMDYAAFMQEYQPGEIPKGDLILLSDGKEIHGSAPWAGRNAIVEVALAGSLMAELSPNAYTRAINFVSQRLGLNYFGDGLIDAQGRGIPFSPPAGLPKPPLGLSEVQYYGTSTNLGLIETDSETNNLRLLIDFRTGLGNENAQLLTHTQYSAGLHGGDADYRTKVGSHYDPFYFPGEHPVMKLALQSYKEVKPDLPAGTPYLYFSPGTTYLKLVRNFINFGPVDIYPDPRVNKFHQPDENITISSLSDNILLFAHTLQKMLQADPSPVNQP